MRNPPARVDGEATGGTAAAARTQVVHDLKELKSPEEGGTKKEYETFLETIQNHITITWDFGKGQRSCGKKHIKAVHP